MIVFLAKIRRLHTCKWCTPATSCARIIVEISQTRGANMLRTCRFTIDRNLRAGGLRGPSQRRDPPFKYAEIRTTSRSLSSEYSNTATHQQDSAAPRFAPTKAMRILHTPYPLGAQISRTLCSPFAGLMQLYDYMGTHSLKQCSVTDPHAAAAIPEQQLVHLAQKFQMNDLGLLGSRHSISIQLSHRQRAGRR